LTTWPQLYDPFNNWIASTAVSALPVLTLFFATDLGFLWFNVIGCAAVVAVSLALSLVRR